MPTAYCLEPTSIPLPRAIEIPPGVVIMAAPACNKAKPIYLSLVPSRPFSCLVKRSSRPLYTSPRFSISAFVAARLLFASSAIPEANPTRALRNPPISWSSGSKYFFLRASIPASLDCVGPGGAAGAAALLLVVGPSAEPGPEVISGVVDGTAATPAMRGSV